MKFSPHLPLAGALVILAICLTAANSTLSSPTLLVAWGNTGGIPAIALLDATPEPIILLPGSDDDGLTVASELEDTGCRKIAVLIMPEGSPYVYGAESIAGKLSVRELVVMPSQRSRITGMELRKRLSSVGTGITLSESGRNEQYHYQWREWHYTFQRLPEGCFKGTLRPPRNVKNVLPVTFELKNSGELEVTVNSIPPAKFLFPKSNQRGTQYIPLTNSPVKM